MTYSDAFREELRAIQKRLNLRQGDFAKAAGVTPGYASQWFSMGRVPERPVLEKMSANLPLEAAECERLLSLAGYLPVLDSNKLDPELILLAKEAEGLPRDDRELVRAFIRRLNVSRVIYGTRTREALIAAG